MLRGNFTFESVGIGGLDKELGQLFRRVLAPRLLPASVRRLHNLGVVRGVLLHGPPGTGKTLTARKIGGLLKVKEERTHVVNGPDLVSKFLGESEANLRGVFDAARSDERRHGANASLHLVIFDEMDAICRPRGHDGGDGGPGLVYDSLVNQLLSILDGVSALDNVLVIGMTNRKDLIDRALLRPGRFEVEIKMPMPTRDGRLAILRIHTNSTALNADVRLAAVAAETAGFTGADIAGVVKSATSAALQRAVEALPPGEDSFPDGALTLRRSDFTQALKEVRPAAGMGREEIGRYLATDASENATAPARLLRVSDGYAATYEAARRLLAPLPSAAPKGGDFGVVSSLLLSGPAGSGRTRMAAHLAWHGNFSFVHIIDADELRGASEGGRLQRLSAVFDDAARAESAVVVLDDIERLLGTLPSATTTARRCS